MRFRKKATILIVALLLIGVLSIFSFDQSPAFTPAYVYACSTYDTLSSTLTSVSNLNMSCNITKGDIIAIMTDCYGYSGSNTNAGFEPVMDSLGTKFTMVSQNYSLTNFRAVYISRVYYGVAPENATNDGFRLLRILTGLLCCAFPFINFCAGGSRLCLRSKYDKCQ